MMRILLTFMSLLLGVRFFLNAFQMGKCNKCFSNGKRGTAFKRAPATGNYSL